MASHQKNESISLFGVVLSDTRRFAQITSIMRKFGLGNIVQIVRQSIAVRSFSSQDVIDGFNRNSPEFGAKLRSAIEALGVTYIKFGQMLSTRYDILPKEIIDELSRLQDGSPTLPFDAIAYIQKAQQLGAPLAASTGALCLAYSSVDAKSLPPNAAIDTCIDAANQNPDNDAIQFRAANHLTNANRFDEATTFYRRALERDPENISYLTALTSNLANTGDYEQAYRLTDKAALTTHAKMPILYHNASIYAYHAKLYDEATAWCNRARDAFGNDDAYDITQAYVEYARGNFDDSLRLIQIPNRPTNAARHR